MDVRSIDQREHRTISYRQPANRGVGARFASSYRHARGAPKAIRPHTRRDQELHRIADQLQAAQRKNFWQLTAGIRQRGNYCHEYSMAVEVECDSPTWQPMTDGAEDAVTEAMRDLSLVLPPGPLGIRAADVRGHGRRDHRR